MVSAAFAAAIVPRRELQLRALPIIALTAGALVSERERSLQAGMNGFMTKPFDPVPLTQVREIRVGCKYRFEWVQ